MESFLNRYRNLSVLLIVLLAQLLLLAYQVRGNQDVRLIRVWAVSGIMPLARLIESVRANTSGFLRDYLVLLDVREDNRRLKKELGALKMENQFLKTELATADRAQALAAFQVRTPSRTIAARIIGTGTGTTSKVVFVDRGTLNGVARGMAVITPDGIVGRVMAAFPTASQVVLITDPSFAAGVLSAKGRVLGTVKGQGHGVCMVDYVQNEDKVAVGEWFFTSGDDRVFPKGLPVGQVKIARPGKVFQEVYLTPSGLQEGLGEVLIVLEGVHQPLPAAAEAAQPVQLLPPPPPESDEDAALRNALGALRTEADEIREKYKRLGEAQGHVFGEGAPGSRPPDFNLSPPALRPPPTPTPPPVAPPPARIPGQQ